jgi:hypothetical protein
VQDLLERIWRAFGGLFVEETLMPVALALRGVSWAVAGKRRGGSCSRGFGVVRREIGERVLRGLFRWGFRDLDHILILVR